ncbi:MAG TPA: radical SAM protein [Desulfuromonadales bacterium]|nr:radical SAM protein [Desulfuromonadales bacterium]
MKAVTVPFFISHQGCPHTCVFCDQRTISGASGVLPASEDILARIELWRATSGSRPLEVAFFGGSFTALPKAIQAELLLPLQPLLNNGTLDSVRISTRPDYIDAGHVEWLSNRGVRTIELGVQSLDDTVLASSGRGHSAAASLNAIDCIKNNGVNVGAQLMPGLPGDTPVTSLHSLEQVIAAGADFLRIYPTVVLAGTELARRYGAGEFAPLSLERGISLCTLLLQRAMQADVPVIRIGLQADCGLDVDHVLAGCWHPSLGQLVRSKLYADLLCRYIPPGKCVTVSCHPARVSDVVGMKRNNLLTLAGRGVQMQVIQDATLKKEELKVTTEDTCTIYSISKDITYSIHEV